MKQKEKKVACSTNNVTSKDLENSLSEIDNSKEDQNNSSDASIERVELRIMPNRKKACKDNLKCLKY